MEIERWTAGGAMKASGIPRHNGIIGEMKEKKREMRK